MGASRALGFVDWRLVAGSALWILGLAILLAALSYHHWLARKTGRRLRDQFTTSAWSRPFALGMTLLCTGVAAGRQVAWWERTLWSVVAMGFAWQLVRQAWRR